MLGLFPYRMSLRRATIVTGVYSDMPDAQAGLLLCGKCFGIAIRLVEVFLCRSITMFQYKLVD